MIIEIAPDNNNLLIFKKNKDDRIPHYLLAMPPRKNGCDIINIYQHELCLGYTYNFNGLVVITENYKRKVYCEGILVAKSKGA